MKNFLRLTCSVLISSVVISGDACSNLFSDLANQAKGTLESAKKGLTDSASNLKKQATDKFNTTKSIALERVDNTKSKVLERVDNTKSKALGHVNDARTKATGLLGSANEKKDALKKAGSDAVSSIKDTAKSIIDPKSDSKPAAEPEKEPVAGADDALLLDKDDTQSLDEDLAKLGIDLSGTETTDDSSLLATENEEQSASDNFALLSQKGTVDSAAEQEASEESAVEDSENAESIFSAEVITKVDSLFSGINSISSGMLLDLSNKALTDEEIAYIATVKVPLLLKQGIEKITLRLSHNASTNIGLKILLDSLKAAPKLVSMIDYSGNKIGDEGAAAIAETLKNIPLLHTILLSDCGITGNGVLELLSSIAELKDYPYQGLDLSKNNIDPSFAPLIIEKLQAIRDDSFGDGINLKETGMQIPEGTILPSNIMI